MPRSKVEAQGEPPVSQKASSSSVKKNPPQKRNGLKGIKQKKESDSTSATTSGDEKICEVDPSAQEKYRIVRRLGKGAYGIVWEAVELGTGSKVALKKIFDAFRNNTDAQRTYREIFYLIQFGSHPNVISLTNAHKAQNDLDFYISFPLMATDLHKLIKNASHLLGLKRVCLILYHISKAVLYIHSADVIHRDIKPANILLNENMVAKLGDFGLARSVASVHISVEENSEMTDYVATRWYRPPEILLNCKRYTKSVDIWSLACILAEMVQKEPLFPASNTLEQIEMVLSTIEKPSRAEVEGLTSATMRSVAHAAIKTRKLSIRESFKDHEPEVVDLLERILIFNPQRRLTIEEVIAHPLLKRNRCPSNEIRMNRSVTPPVDDNFGYSLRTYRTLLYNMLKNGEIITETATNSDSKHREVTLNTNSKRKKVSVLTLARNQFDIAERGGSGDAPGPTHEQIQNGEKFEPNHTGLISDQSSEVSNSCNSVTNHETIHCDQVEAKLMPIPFLDRSFDKWSRPFSIKNECTSEASSCQTLRKRLLCLENEKHMEGNEHFHKDSNYRKEKQLLDTAPPTANAAELAPSPKYGTRNPKFQRPQSSISYKIKNSGSAEYKSTLHEIGFLLDSTERDASVARLEQRSRSSPNPWTHLPTGSYAQLTRITEEKIHQLSLKQQTDRDKFARQSTQVRETVDGPSSHSRGSRPFTKHMKYGVQPKRISSHPKAFSKLTNERVPHLELKGHVAQIPSQVGRSATPYYQDRVSIEKRSENGAIECLAIPRTTWSTNTLFPPFKETEETPSVQILREKKRRSTYFLGANFDHGLTSSVEDTYCNASPSALVYTRNEPQRNRIATKINTSTKPRLPYQEHRTARKKSSSRPPKPTSLQSMRYPLAANKLHEKLYPKLELNESCNNHAIVSSNDLDELKRSFLQTATL